MARRCDVLRVFTRGDDGGNHLGVITDVTGLGTESMQAIAAELGFSETIYLEGREGEIAQVRIFTPGAELPFAGHPLVGMAWALEHLGPGGVTTLRCAAFDATVRVEGDTASVEVPSGQPVRPAPEASELAGAVGLPEPVAAWRVDMPVPYLLIEVAAPDRVASAVPGTEKEFEESGTDMVYLYAFDTPTRVRARFFAPGHGVFEDPATGSAAVALAAARRAAGQFSGRLVIEQGSEIGHPSAIHLEWQDEWVRIGGTVRREETRLLDY